MVTIALALFLISIYAIRKANLTPAKTKILIVSKRDFKKLEKELQSPPREPSERMKRAINRYKEEFDK